MKTGLRLYPNSVTLWLITGLCAIIVLTGCNNASLTGTPISIAPPFTVTHTPTPTQTVTTATTDTPTALPTDTPAPTETSFPTATATQTLTPTATHTPAPTVRPSPSPTPIPPPTLPLIGVLFDPSEIWIFYGHKIHVLDSIRTSSTTYYPQNGHFLVIEGRIYNIGTEGRSILGSRFTLEHGGRTYRLEYANMDPYRQATGLDYPGLILGQYVPADDFRETFLIFDIHAAAGAPILHFDGIYAMVLGDFNTLRSTAPLTYTYRSPHPDNVRDLADAIDTLLGPGNTPLGRLRYGFDSDSRALSYEIGLRADEYGALDIDRAFVDTAMLLALVATSDNIRSRIDYDYLVVRGVFPVTDIYGQVSNQTIFRASYTGPRIVRIDWERFQYQNIFNVANHVTYHPDFSDRFRATE